MSAFAVHDTLRDDFPYVRTRRLDAQRWLLDATIRQLGVDWDQGRSRYLAAACGVDAEGDFARVRERVRKFADIEPAFAGAAGRREALADAAAADGRQVAEREHAFVAAVLWGAAQWPLFGNSPRNLAYGDRKVACYQRFVAHAPHPVERIEIPFGDRTLPAYLHLPRAHRGAHPCVVQVGGMDSFKEHLVALYGDRFLERGIARLTFDGPGQGESLNRALFATAENVADAGRAVIDRVRSHPAIDPLRIGLAGVSFGSFWATRIAAGVDGLAGCATAMAMHEPGMRTLFEQASPTYKARFMYLSGFTDEDAFDAFAASLTLADAASGVTCPYLAVAGEADDLSPIEHTWRVFDSLGGSRELVLYQGEKHGIAGGPAAALGPDRDDLVAEWFVDRFAGIPAEDRLRYVDVTGRVTEQPLPGGRA